MHRLLFLANFGKGIVFGAVSVYNDVIIQSMEEYDIVYRKME